MNYTVKSILGIIHSHRHQSELLDILGEVGLLMTLEHMPAEVGVFPRDMVGHMVCNRHNLHSLCWSAKDLLRLSKGETLTRNRWTLNVGRILFKTNSINLKTLIQSRTKTYSEISFTCVRPLLQIYLQFSQRNVALGGLSHYVVTSHIGKLLRCIWDGIE